MSEDIWMLFWQYKFFLIQFDLDNIKKRKALD